jgi:hypothetical protein
MTYQEDHTNEGQTREVGTVRNQLLEVSKESECESGNSDQRELHMV